MTGTSIGRKHVPSRVDTGNPKHIGRYLFSQNPNC